jgi:hypothetical protein
VHLTALDRRHPVLATLRSQGSLASLFSTRDFPPDTREPPGPLIFSTPVQTDRAVGVLICPATGDALGPD